MECELFSWLIPSKIAAYIQQWEQRYKQDYKKGFSRIVMDEGALGRSIAEECRQTFGVPIEAAEKLNKRTYIEMVSGDMKSGTIKIHPWKARALVSEIQILPWDEEREAPDERFQDHAADAFLYACRAVRPWYRPEREPPAYGSPEWLAEQQRKWRADAAKKVREKQKRRFGGGRR